MPAGGYAVMIDPLDRTVCALRVEALLGAAPRS
jgi:hypothetical protein